MREAAWSGYTEPSYIAGPGEAHVFFGADTHWGPECEPVDGRGNPMPPRNGICPRCGSEGRWALPLPMVVCAADGFVPLIFLWGRIGRGSLDYCATCVRWGRDDRVVAAMLSEIAERGSFLPIAETVEDVINRRSPSPQPRPTPHYEVIRERIARRPEAVGGPPVPIPIAESSP